MALALRFFVVSLHDVWKYRCKYVAFLFVILTYFSLHHNYVIYLFDVITFSYDIRITLCFGAYQLRMEITLQLCFVFVRHYDVFFIKSQLRYLFVRCRYIFE